MMLQSGAFGREKGGCALIEGTFAFGVAHFSEKSSAGHLVEGGGDQSSDFCRLHSAWSCEAGRPLERSLICWV